MSSHSSISCATLAAVSCAAILSIILPSRAVARIESHTAPEAAVFTAGTGRARLSLAEPRDVATGAAKRPSPPRSLASTDFDNDGNADVATGFATDTGGLVSIALGDGRGGFRPAHDVVLPEAADFLVAGDLDGDGLADLAAAARRGTSVSVLGGDGRGNFALVASRPLPGAATALAAGEIGRRDRIADLAVAISDGTSNAVLVYPRTGAEPERVDLAVEAGALAIADVDDDGVSELAAAAGPELVVASGRTAGERSVVTLGFERPIVSVVSGRFAGGARLALLDENGDASYVLARRDERGLSLTSRFGAALPGATGLLAANLSTGEGDDLVALEDGGALLRTLATEGERTVELSAPVGAPVAAVAARLNGDALADLVTLDGSGSAPRALLTAAAATFTVTNTNDSGDGSLRKAIEDANANPGADLISFAIPGKGVHTIALAAVLPKIADAVTIDGYTQPGSRANSLAVGGDASILVEIDGSNAKGDADGSNGLLSVVGATTIRGLAINGFGESPQDETGGGVVFTNSDTIFDCFVVGCYIGTDATGTVAKGNGKTGVGIFNAETRVGGLNPADRNVISGNGAGVTIVNASRVFVLNNYIGTDSTGTADLTNGTIGVAIKDGAHDNQIGGLTPEAANVIARGVFGVSIEDANTTRNEVLGNLIGTDATGTRPLGPGSGGVFVARGASENSIALNTIAASGLDGVLVVAGSFSNEIVNNSIGTDREGKIDLGNGATGVNILLGAAGNTVSSNKIAFNGAQGVRVGDGGSDTISKNSIFANGGVGIDLNGDGATANDAGDADTGANNLQNFPVLTSAAVKNDTIVVSGTLDSTPNTSFEIELFVNDDVSAGQAKRVIAETVTVTTDAKGSAAFALTIPGAAGAAVIATATELTTGNTSELSVPLAVVAKPRVVCLVDVASGDTFSITVLKGDPDFAKWTYRIAKTGRTISGKATSMVFIQPDILNALESDGVGILMSAHISIGKAKGNVSVIDLADGVKLRVINDTVAGGGCEP